MGTSLDSLIEGEESELTRLVKEMVYVVDFGCRAHTLPDHVLTVSYSGPPFQDFTYLCKLSPSSIQSFQPCLPV